MFMLQKMSMLASKRNAVALPIVANAVDFDGTNDYMPRGAGLTGAADSSTGILSVWLRFDGSDGIATRLFSSFSGHLVFQKLSTNTFSLNVNNGSASFIFLSTTAYTAGATWYHFLASWDTNYSAGNKIEHLYVNDAYDLGTVTDSGAAFTVDYTDTNWHIGATSAGGSKFNGCMAEFYFAPGQYLDFSDSANRRKFINSLGKPVDLGSDGSTPTGVAPVVYLKNVAASYGTNSGTGGNFTITGALTTASTSPSD
mgnify:CR=1 FL=1